MAFLENVLGGTAGGILAGVAVAVVAPAILPAGIGLGSLAKTVVRGVLAITDGIVAVGHQVTETVGDLVVEARNDLTAGTRGVSL